MTQHAAKFYTPTFSGNISLTKTQYFSKLYYRSPFNNNKVNIITVTLPYKFAILPLPFADIMKFELLHRTTFQCNDIYINFREIHLPGLAVERRRCPYRQKSDLIVQFLFPF
jgi:hypothetical protein